MRFTPWLAGVLFAWGCSTSGAFGNATAGAEGQACRPGGGCDAGLVCLSNLCVQPPGTGGTGGAAGGGGGAGGTTSNGGGGTGGTDPDTPVASINHPGDGETRLRSDGAFPFVGAATDPQDGALSGAALVWTSSLDGQIGTGATFNYNPSLGTHVITLTATDSTSKQGTDSITITMQP